MSSLSAKSSLQKNRFLYLDIARTIAIISISLNHAVNRTYDNYSDQYAQYLELSTLSSIFKSVITVFSRIGVPLFLMITGVLILNKKFENENDLKRFYKHNWFNIFLTTEIWYFIFYWFIVFFNPGNNFLETLNIKGLSARCLSTMLFLDQTTLGNMWYMPMIICLYLILPFVAFALARFPKKYMAIPISVSFFVCMLLPVINQYLAFRNIDTIPTIINTANIPSIYMIYIFVGFCLSKGLLSKVNNWILLLLLVTTFTTACWYQYYAYSMPQNYLIAYQSPAMLLCAMLILELIKRKEGLFKGLSKVFIYISKITFGIFFVHIIIMEFLNYYFDFSKFPPPLKLTFLEIVSVGGSIIIIALLSKVKIFKKYLFMIKD